MQQGQKIVSATSANALNGVHGLCGFQICAVLGIDLNSAILLYIYIHCNHSQILVMPCCLSFVLVWLYFSLAMHTSFMASPDLAGLLTEKYDMLNFHGDFKPYLSYLLC